MENNVNENIDVVETDQINDETVEETVQSGYVNITECDEETVEDNKTTVYGLEGIVDEDNASAFKFLNLKSQLTDISKLSDQLKERTNQFIDRSKDEDDIDALDEYIESAIDKVSEEDIQGMSDDEIDEFLTFNGTPLTFSLEFDDEEKYKTFKKDYLLFRKRSHDSIKSLDDEIQKINDEIAKSQEEFEEICNKYGNITNLVIETLHNKYKTEENEEKKALYKNLIDSLNYGLTLENFKEYLHSYRGLKVLSDFRFPKSSMEIYRKYKKVNDSLNIKIDLKNFPDFELRVLGEEYNKRPNIILFAMMHFISSKYNKEIDKSFGVFISQFTVNLRNLWFDKFEKEDEKTIFVDALKEVIDIIG